MKAPSRMKSNRGEMKKIQTFIQLKIHKKHKE
jgi:hypothetical protein